LKVETKVQNRDISQSNPSLLNHRQEINLSNRVILEWRGEKIHPRFAFFTSQVTNLAARQTTDRPESRTDWEGLQAAFNFSTLWRASQTDNLNLTFSYTKYEYSSPDTTQSIDEDDLRFLFDLKWFHHFSQYFSLEFDVNLYWYHQIYIYASRSANNNWNRIFQMGPSFRFKIPEVLEHSNRFKILANYTVYDFDDLLPKVRSFIFRKMIFSDSLSLKLSKGLKLVTFYQLEKEDDGTFFKNIFAQQIGRELTSHFIDVRLVYLRLKGLRFSTGMSWFFRKEWSFYPEKRISRDYRDFSPKLTILYSLGPRLLLHIAFAPKVYRDLHICRQYFATGKINLRYTF